MSSVNPVFALPHALDTLATAYIDSVTLGVGQFCTNPGLVIALEKKGTQSMLTAGIAAAYADGIEYRDATAKRIATGTKNDASSGALPVLHRVSAEKLLAKPQLAEEIFGPTSVIVVCRDEDEMIAVACHLEGQLTATLLIEKDDIELARRLLPVLERKAGRILANGFPTGVEVSYAMVHGGPFPATSDSRSTSVGAMAIERFLRPVCYQDLPAALLPEALADDNPLSLWRLRDGELGRTEAERELSLW